MQLYTEKLEREPLWEGSLLATMTPFATLATFDQVLSRRIKEMERTPDLEPDERSFLAALKEWKQDVWG